MLRSTWTILLLFSVTYAHSQSCCSGGVPLSSNLGLPISEKNTFQASISYDLNVLNTLKDGTTRLEDNTRKRTTHSILTQIGYTVNDKFSFDLMLPYVSQERELSPVGQNGTFSATNGVGDLLLLAKYQFVKNYQIGIGIKFPTGSTVEKNDIGLTLNADMQPGSGSWDIIYWFSGIQNLKVRPSTSVGLVATYRATGENPDYFNTQVYAFGNEVQATVTIADQLLIGNLILNPSMAMKYRHVASDVTDDTEVPSTGGSWVFLRPGLGYGVTQYINLQLSTEIPVFAKLEGTQVTPTVRFNMALIIKILNKKNLEL